MKIKDARKMYEEEGMEELIEYLYNYSEDDIMVLDCSDYMVDQLGPFFNQEYKDAFAYVDKEWNYHPITCFEDLIKYNLLEPDDDEDTDNKDNKLES